MHVVVVAVDVVVNHGIHPIVVLNTDYVTVDQHHEQTWVGMHPDYVSVLPSWHVVVQSHYLVYYYNLYIDNH